MRATSSRTKGLPPAPTAAFARAAGAISWLASAPRRARACASVSSSRSRLASGWPTNSVGNVVTSEARPSATTAKGRPTRFRSAASKSRMLGRSAECASSTTSTIGPAASSAPRSSSHARIARSASRTEPAGAGAPSSVPPSTNEVPMASPSTAAVSQIASASTCRPTRSRSFFRRSASGSCGPTSASRCSTSLSVPNGRGRPLGSPCPHQTVAPSAPAMAVISAASRVFPMPAGPVITAQRATGREALSARSARKTSISRSRPTSASIPTRSGGTSPGRTGEP